MAGGLRLAARMTPEQSVLVCLSGRGDKDLAAVLDHWAAKGERRIDGTRSLRP